LGIIEIIMDKVNIEEKLDCISEYWKPIIIGELNNQHVKLAKVKGEFVIHKHENEDELFLVLKGQLIMDYGEKVDIINEGEFVIVPKGTYHKPIAKSETHLLLFEPSTTLNTGNVRNDFTVDSLERI